MRLRADGRVGAAGQIDIGALDVIGTAIRFIAGIHLLGKVQQIACMGDDERIFCRAAALQGVGIDGGCVFMYRTLLKAFGLFIHRSFHIVVELRCCTG